MRKWLGYLWRHSNGDWQVRRGSVADRLYRAHYALKGWRVLFEALARDPDLQAWSEGYARAWAHRVALAWWQFTRNDQTCAWKDFLGAHV